MTPFHHSYPYCSYVTPRPTLPLWSNHGCSTYSLVLHSIIFIVIIITVGIVGIINSPMYEWSLVLLVWRCISVFFFNFQVSLIAVRIYFCQQLKVDCIAALSTNMMLVRYIFALCENELYICLTCMRGVKKVHSLTQVTATYTHHIYSLFNIVSYNWNVLGP